MTNTPAATRQRMMMTFIVLMVLGMIWVDYTSRQERERQALLKELEGETPPAATGDSSDTPPENPPAAGAGETKSPESPETPPEEPAIRPDESPEEIVTVETPHYIAEFTNRGGTLRRLVLPQYKQDVGGDQAYLLLDELVPGRRSFELQLFDRGDPAAPRQLGDLSQIPWQAARETGKDGETVLRYSTVTPDGIECIKEFRVPAQGGLIGLFVTLRNAGAAPRTLSYRVLPAQGFRLGVEDGFDYSAAFCPISTDSWDHWNPTYIAKKNAAVAAGQPLQDFYITDYAIRWAGMHNKYFFALLQPMPSRQPDGTEITPPIIEFGGYQFLDPLGGPQQQHVTAFLDMKPVELAPTHTVTQEFRYFAGPRRDGDRYEIWHLAHNKSVWLFRWMDFVAVPTAKLLTGVMLFLQKVFADFGLAVICLTIIVRSCMHPLSRMQYRSMRGMSMLAPRLQAIRAKFKKDPKKMQQETFKVYAEYGVNPFVGCLPMLIQMPIFFGLWMGVGYTIELRHSTFMWIRDLAQPDHLFALGFQVPWLGWTSFNLLPVLMVVTTAINMHLQPKAADPDQRMQQNMMLWVMPAFMLLLFYNMPAGLTLYFLASNFYGIIEAKLNERVFNQSDLARRLREAVATA